MHTCLCLFIYSIQISTLLPLSHLETGFKILNKCLMMILKKSIEARMIQSQIDIDNHCLSLIVEI